MTEQNLAPQAVALEQATLAGGCYWCLEAVFVRLEGVHQVVSGFSNGHDPQPTYDSVCSGRTGHAEVVRVAFDPQVISYHDLLEVFFAMHDPTTLNRQGADVGSQYRSGVYVHSPEQAQTASALIQALNAQRVFDAPIVTEVAPVHNFHVAPAEHQGYFEQHPQQGYCAVVIAPKVQALRQKFAARLKDVARSSA